MAIQNRRGPIGLFNPNKMLTGEWAFPDDGTGRYCVTPGNVKTVATVEDLQSLLDSSAEAYSALQQLIADLELNPSELTNILSNISVLQSGKLDKTGDSKDNTVTFDEALTRENIVTTEKISIMIGKIKKWFTDLKALAFKDKVAATDLDASLTGVISGKFNKSDIIQTTAVNDANKVPSSAVTYSLANSINGINDNLATVDYPQSAFTFNSSIVSEVRIFSCKKIGNEVVLDIALTITGVGSFITAVSSVLQPITSQSGVGINYDGTVGGTVIALVNITNTDITATTWNPAKPYFSAQLRWRTDM